VKIQEVVRKNQSTKRAGGSYFLRFPLLGGAVFVEGPLPLPKAKPFWGAAARAKEAAAGVLIKTISPDLSEAETETGGQERTPNRERASGRGIRQAYHF